jgi:ubiquinone biosynthesis protein Coq4
MPKQLHLEQNCELTLQNALDQYYLEHPDFYQPSDMDAESKKVFLAHDVCHVIFGCDTNIRGEVIAEQWIMNGTNVGAKNYMDALLNNETTVAAVQDTINPKSIFQGIISAPVALKTLWRARKLEPKWDFYNYQKYLQTSVNQIRAEYKIKII